MILLIMLRKSHCSNMDRCYCRTEKYTDCTNERKNGMLEKIIDAAFEKFLETDTEELLEKRDGVVKKIMEEEALTAIHLDDWICDVCCDYEDVAFRAGFMACVECIEALNGR